MRSYPLVLFVGAAAAFAAVGAVSARAATITDNVKFSATVPAVQSPPVDPVVGDFTITFDPRLDYVNETTGVQGNGLNIALAFLYSTADGILRVGGIEMELVQSLGSPTISFSTLEIFQRVRFSLASHTCREQTKSLKASVPVGR
jgi:hypothetical protein